MKNQHLRMVLVNPHERGPGAWMRALVFLMFVACSAAGDVPTKVAILPSAQAHAQFADLLTAEMSQWENVTLLEREQIDKIITEQSLATFQRQDVIRIGRLLNADGVLLLERRVSQQQEELLAIRLLAVRPGVTIAEHQFGLPLADPLEWAKEFAGRLEREFPRLAVKAKNATPVSVANLRASTTTADGLSLERELTTLLHLRLAREPSVFLLERRSLETLRAEKAMGADDEPFWSGAYVIDGMINRDVFSATEVTLHVRVASPGSAPVLIERVGRRSELAPLVNEVVERILSAVGKPGESEPWDAQREAEKFSEEAQWAARWFLWQNVIEAADASWALGKRTPEVARLRMLGRSKLIPVLRGPFDYQSVGAYGFRRPPAPESLLMLSRMLEIYLDCSRFFLGATNDLIKANWGGAGVEALTAGTSLLERYQSRPEFQLGHDTELARARALLRETAALLQHSRSRLWNPGSGDRPLQLWFNSQGLWFDTPEEAVALYRSLIDEDYAVYSEVRTGLVVASIYRYYSPKLPSMNEFIPLAAWTAKDRARVHSVWMDFLQEMSGSTNRQVRLDGWMLMLPQLTDPEELEQVARKYFNEASADVVSVLAVRVDAPVDYLFSNVVRRIEHWNVPQYETMVALRDAAITVFNEADPDMSYEIWKDILTRLADPKVASWAVTFPSVPPRPEQMQDLIAAFEQSDRDNPVGWRIRSYLNELRALLKRSTAVASDSPALNQQEAERAVPALVISRVWRLEDVKPPPDRLLAWNPWGQNMGWTEDRLWLETQTRHIAQDGSSQSAVVMLDHQTLRGTLIEAPFESFQAPGGPRKFLVVEGEIFVSAPGALWRRNRAGEWNRFPLATSQAPLAMRWGDRIALQCAETIQVLNPHSGEVRLLASTRRNPPASAIDDAPSHEPFEKVYKGPIAVWPDGHLYVHILGSIWRYEPDKADWVLFRAAARRVCSEIVELHADGMLFRQFGHCGPRLLGGWRPGMGSEEFYTWSTQSRLASPWNVLFTPPLWEHRLTSRPHVSEAQFDGPNLWVFPSPHGWDPFRPDPDRLEAASNPVPIAPSNMMFFSRELDSGLEVSIRFSGPALEYSEHYEKERLRHGPKVEFLPTPQGLAILVVERGILFWAPRNDVDAVLAEAKARQKPKEGITAANIRRFDLNGNGWLDEAENETMLKHASWQRALQLKYDADSKAAIQQHGAEWKKLFAQADQDGDGRLSISKLLAAVEAHPAALAPRLRGVNGPPREATRAYDLDNDTFLDLDEFLAFMADPRLPAQVSASIQWSARSLERLKGQKR